MVMQNIMSVLLVHGESSQQALFSALHAILLTECLAQPAGPGIYRTLLPRAGRQLELFWRFEPVKGGNLRLSIRPQLADGLPGSLRVDCQRGFVDLLRAISVCNRDKNRTMSFVVTEYSYVEVLTMFPAAYLKDVRLVRKLVKNTLAQLPVTFDRLFGAIQPFLEPQEVLPVEDGMNHTARCFLNHSYKMLLLVRRNHLERAGQERAERRLEEDRAAAFEKMHDALRLMGSEASFLRAASSSDPAFSEWKHRNKDHPQSKTKEKNVFSVKLLAEMGKSVEKDSSGSHCRILLATYRLSIAISVNSEIVLAARELRNSSGMGLLEQTTRELQLVKKQVKNPHREQSKNSFQNQLDFIYYIRDRSCKFVSTYYWQYNIKRQDAAAILMDYYPHNLREMLQAQGKLLSFREKLLLLQRVTASVSWLASNYICHRDIKPENIMISQERLPKLVDFGSCCPVYGAGPSHLQVSETRLLGTASYFRAFNEATSGGYKKYEYEQHMLFDAYSLGKVMRDVLEEGVPRLLPNLHALVAYVMERCEEEDPADRLTYQEMLFLFENFLQYLEYLEGNLKE